MLAPRKGNSKIAHNKYVPFGGPTQLFAFLIARSALIISPLVGATGIDFSEKNIIPAKSGKLNCIKLGLGIKVSCTLEVALCIGTCAYHSSAKRGQGAPLKLRDTFELGYKMIMALHALAAACIGNRGRCAETADIHIVPGIAGQGPHGFNVRPPDRGSPQ